MIHDKGGNGPFIAELKYLKESNQEITARPVLVTRAPESNVTAIDLTDVSVDEREELLNAYQEYADYRSAMIDSLFNFETWYEHSYGDPLTVKWRAFKERNIISVTDI